MKDKYTEKREALAEEVAEKITNDLMEQGYVDGAEIITLVEHTLSDKGDGWISVESGWHLLSADFSLQASGKSRTGFVTLVRDKEAIQLWHKLEDDLKESDDCPELYVSGKGRNIFEAIVNANLLASHARPLPSPPQE